MRAKRATDERCYVRSMTISTRSGIAFGQFENDDETVANAKPELDALYMSVERNKGDHAYTLVKT